MQIYMVVDPSDYGRIIGYYVDGQIYEDLSDIPRPKKWLGGREGVVISADMVYVEGEGLKNLAQLREMELAKSRLRAEIELGLEMDAFTRSLLGYHDQP